jgi:hypothetical protein
MPKPLTAQRVFISHSREDTELVRDIARRLRGAGFETFEDFEEFDSGAEFKKHLRERLSQANVFLILLTPRSLRSSWIMTELGMAEALGRQVVPVTVGLRPQDLPAPLQTYQTVPFDRLDGAIGELSERLLAPSEE